jgi:hypothetical protein
VRQPGVDGVLDVGASDDHAQAAARGDLVDADRVFIGGLAQRGLDSQPRGRFVLTRRLVGHPWPLHRLQRPQV